MKSVVNPLASAVHLRAAIVNVTIQADKSEKRASAMVEKLRAAEFVSETDIGNIEYSLNAALRAVEEATRMTRIFADRYLS